MQQEQTTARRQGLGTLHLQGLSENMMGIGPKGILILQVLPKTHCHHLPQLNFDVSHRSLQTVTLSSKKEKAEQHKRQRSHSIQGIHDILCTQITRRPLDFGGVSRTCKCCCGQVGIWCQAYWMAWRRLIAKSCLCKCHMKHCLLFTILTFTIDREQVVTRSLHLFNTNHGI
jgi:hypothetical protein